MIETHLKHTVTFCILTTLPSTTEGRQSFSGGDFNSMTKKKKSLAQIVKHIIAQCQCELSDYLGSYWLSSLSSASASLKPVHKLLGCLVLQVGAHVAGVGAVCMASKYAPVETVGFR